MNATTVAVDLAKDVFQVAVASRAGRITERKRLTRRQFERFLDTLAPGTTRGPDHPAPRQPVSTVGRRPGRPSGPQPRGGRRRQQARPDDLGGLT